MSAPATLTPFHAAEARDLLAALFEATPGRIEVRPLDREGAPRVDLRAFCDTPEEALAAAERAAKAGVNVYFGVATRGAAASGAKDNVCAARALWVDLDPTDGETLDALRSRLEGVRPSPSLVVASGGGLHVYWLLEEPYLLGDVTARDRFEVTLRGLAAAIGGDRAAAEAARVLRVPGTLNLPNAQKRAKGRAVASVALVESTGALYCFEDFDDFELRGRAEQSQPRESGAKAGESVGEGGRHSFLLGIAASLRRQGLTGSALEAALLGVNAEQCNPSLPEAEVRELARWAATREGGMPYTGPSRGAEEWTAPLPLEGATPPDFPTAALPHWLADFVKATAEATQTPHDLAGSLVLATLAASVARKARVEVKPGYLEPLNLFVAVALDPGNLKSPVFSAVNAPLLESERELSGAARERVAVLEEELAAAKADREEARKKKERGRSVELAQRMRDLEEELAALPPRLVTDDATPEALAALLVKHKRMAALSAEGGEVFEIARGRYSGNARPNIGVYLKGHSGDPLVVDRKRESLYVERPALTLGLAVQPSVIRALRGDGEFRDRGLLARFLYAVPRSLMGSRDFRAAAPAPSAVAAEYRTRMLALLRLPVEESERVVRLSPEARELVEEYRQELEPELGADGRYAWVSDWVSKLPGACARIAGLLHAAEWADRPDPFTETVSAATMRDALALGRYYLDHALAAFESMEADPALAGAAKLWRFVASQGKHEVTQREAWQGVKGGRFERTADLEEPFRVLEERGFLRRRPLSEEERKRPGKPSVVYLVNPRALS